ncbi:MAG: desulfoferrodoxin [Planctomycetaceae bacterium]|jgi:superoxide reductase|nr:desulfoferrodoxin [Planctomycetaceae bacterium]
MTKQDEVYVCKLCGNIVEVLEGAGGSLTCCQQEMVLQKENTADAAKAKHVPVVTVNGTKAAVQVGSVPHPMEDKHHIAWIELQQGSKVQRQYLKPGAEPKAEFTVEEGVPVTVREYCNLHGLWNVQQ